MNANKTTERCVFEALAQILGLRVAPGSICQGKPSLPDIECQLKNSGPLAVELVALDDGRTRRHRENMRKNRARLA